MNYSTKNNKKRHQVHKSKVKKVKNKLGVIVFRLFVAALLIGVFAIGGAGIGAYFAIIEGAPTLSRVEVSNETYDTFVNDKNGLEIDRLDGGENREYADFEKIPQYMKDAFVAIEDERFYSHDGVDLKAFGRAIYQTLTDKPQGASTITQQLIKNKLKIKRNSIVTKLREQYLSINYEKTLIEELGSKKEAKDYILGQYMNIIALGHGQNGVQAAAKYYFGKNVSELTLAECTAIAATTQNPTGYSPSRFPEENKKRQTIALNNMLEFGMITQKEYEDAKNQDVYSAIQKTGQESALEASFHSYYVDRVISEVSMALQATYGYTASEASYKIFNSGLTINTCLDPKIQGIIDEAYMDESLFPSSEYEVAVTYICTTKNEITHKKTNYEKKGVVKKLGDVKALVETYKDEILGTDDVVESDVVYYAPQPQSSMVVLDYHNGHVAGIAGGRGVKLTNRAFNRATDAKRQPGSVYKVLASYLPAIDMNTITPATVYDDVPFERNGWEPKNWYREPPFRGLNTVRTAIEQSMNIIAVKNMDETGIDSCFNYLQKLGFTTLDKKDKTLSTALGGITQGVTQLEATSAFGTIANGGMRSKPIFFTTVLDHDGKVLLENTPEPKQVIKKASAYLLTDMMKGVITSGTGGKAAFKKVKMPLAGKTGTTSDNKDLNFVGYSPYYVAGIWLGYDQPKPMNSTTTKDGNHLRMWSYVMEKIHQDLEYKEFPKPTDIAKAKICTVSGKLAVDNLCNNDPRGSKVKEEIFAVGTVPTESCDVHESYTVDKTSNEIPTQFCPPDSIETRVGIKRPEPYTGNDTVADAAYELPEAVIHNIICKLHTSISTPVPVESTRPPEDSQNPAPAASEPAPTASDSPVERTPTPINTLPLLPIDIIPTTRNTPVVAPTKRPTAAPTPTPTARSVQVTTVPKSSSPAASEGPLIIDNTDSRPIIVDKP